MLRDVKVTPPSFSADGILRKSLIQWPERDPDNAHLNRELYEIGLEYMTNTGALVLFGRRRVVIMGTLLG
jgi:hypothetical protein